MSSTAPSEAWCVWGWTRADAVETAVTSFERELGRADVPVLVQPVVSGVEFAVGVVRDPSVGPLVMVGAGGVNTDLLADRVYLLPPVRPSDVRRALRALRCWPLLDGFRGAAPVDVDGLVDVVVACGRLADEIPLVAELDVNPVMVSSAGCALVDVKLRLAETRSTGCGRTEAVAAYDVRQPAHKPTRSRNRRCHRPLRVTRPVHGSTCTGCLWGLGRATVWCVPPDASTRRSRRGARVVQGERSSTPLSGSSPTARSSPSRWPRCGPTTTAERGVVAEGPVGLRWLGRSRLFRYEVRRWRNGTIPDLAHAVGGPRKVETDRERVARLLALVPDVPAATWGLDELGAGEMWNSNSLISWSLAMSGHDISEILPPAGGRAPGWFAGLAVASPTAPSRLRIGPHLGAGRSGEHGGCIIERADGCARSRWPGRTGKRPRSWDPSSLTGVAGRRARRP